MPAQWERTLDRWRNAGLVDAATSERIRLFESKEAESGGLNRPVIMALILGGIALAAGVLLFVAAHWENISPSARFFLVLLLVAIFHVAGAFSAPRFAALATTFHALGTMSLGAGIFLAGQIFNLQEHWPSGLMLWALGAWIGWGFLGDAVQAVLAALLTPGWLASEWMVATDFKGGNVRVLATGLLLLSIAYLAACTNEKRDLIRRALAIVGAVALLPLVMLDTVAWSKEVGWQVSLATGLEIFGWMVAFLLPAAVVYVLRGRDGWPIILAAAWALGLGMLSREFLNINVSPPSETNILVYFWCALGFWALGAWGAAEGSSERVRAGTAGFGAAFLLYTLVLVFERQAPAYLWIWPVLGWVACVGWGVRERRSERINLGVAGFALSIILFYFSNVMDKLDRSVSLIILGILFLAGGWALERLRRKLVRQTREARA